MLLAKKADAEHMRSELCQKADKESVDAQLAMLANKDDVERHLAAKADRDNILVELVKKADKHSIGSELAKKADKDYMDAELARLASAAGVKFEGPVEKNLVVSEMAWSADAIPEDDCSAGDANKDYASLTNESGDEAALPLAQKGEEICGLRLGHFEIESAETVFGANGGKDSAENELLPEEFNGL